MEERSPWFWCAETAGLRSDGFKSHCNLFLYSFHTGLNEIVLSARTVLSLSGCAHASGLLKDVRTLQAGTAG